jgi:hypothetical protein
MPRANDKPFPCTNCRFAIDRECRRNPPTAISDIDSVDYEYRSSIQAQFPPADSGCFAGEPRVQRSCATCIGNEECTIFKYIQTTHVGSVEDRSCDDWHCTDWEAFTE